MINKPSLTHDTSMNFNLHTCVLFALTENLHLLTHHPLLMGHIFTCHPQTSWRQTRSQQQQHIYTIIFRFIYSIMQKNKSLSNRLNVCLAVGHTSLGMDSLMSSARRVSMHGHISCLIPIFIRSRVHTHTQSITAMENALKLLWAMSRVVLKSQTGIAQSPN